MNASPDRIEALLVDLGRKLDKLLEVVDAQKPPALSEDDLRRLKVLLPAVHAGIGSVVWSVHDLMLRPEPPIVAALADVALSPKMIGKLLARAAEVPIGGLRVERAKEVREGVLWAVEQV